MTKIVVDGFLDPAIQARVHAGHYLDFYLFFVKEMIEREKSRQSDSRLMNEFGQTYGNWAQEEIYKVGLVTVYHHWEKCISKLLKNQESKNSVKLLKNTSRLPFVDHIRKNLEDVFNCFVDEAIWSELNEAREIVNCYKHGTSDKFESLYLKYPSYFVEFDVGEDLDYSDYFLLGEKNLDRLGKNIQNFWDTLPRECKF